MEKELTAVLIYNNPTLIERIYKTGPSSDFIYVIQKGGSHPGGFTNSKTILRIDFRDSRSESKILEDIATECEGEVIGVPLPPVGFYSTGSCVSIPHYHRKNTKRRVEKYIKKCSN